jgi:uncharacterized protein (TIGR02594 family)
MGPAAALAFARQHLGEDEIRDQSKLQDFFRKEGVSVNPRTTAWCAGFVNASLKEAGITGPGGGKSLAAADFVKYGTNVEPKDIQPGDIGVVRGTSSGTGREGKHVGFLTGETRMVNGRLQAKMLGGNQGGTVSGKGGVSEQWRDVSQLHLRRPPAPSDSPEGRAVAAGPTGGGGSGADRQAIAAGAGGKVDPGALNERLQGLIKGSKLEGYMPPDAAKYGFKSGSAAEWAGLMTGMAGKESGYKAGLVGDVGHFGSGSRGLFQLSAQDAITYGLQRTPFTAEQLADPDFNARMAVKIAEKRALKGGVGGKGGMADYWAGHNKPGSYLARGEVPAGTDRIDTAVNGGAGMKAEGTVNVHVHAPRGTKTAADSDGMFQNTNIKNYRQMQPTTEPIVGPG